MSKQEQLIEYSIQDIVEFIADDFAVEYDEAMKLFYESETFDKLQQIDTGLYRESPAYVYGLFQDEQNLGRIVQAEV